jgi:hypothetical protein
MTRALFLLLALAACSAPPEDAAEGRLADPTQSEDAAPVVLRFLAPRLAPGGCAAPRIARTELVGFDGPAEDAARPWRERWTVSGCGRTASAMIRFTPGRDATAFRVTAAP